MKLPVFLSLVLVFLLGAFAQNKPRGETKDLAAYADQTFGEAIEAGEIAGAAVMVYQDGKVLLDAAYGYASLEWSVPMTTGASFEIGSVTKQFTAAAILKLAEAGKLSLEDDFTQYLDFDTGGRKITVRQLLDHTSGIASYTEVPDFWALSMHQHPRDSLVRLVEQQAFLFEPGEAMIYNNSGYYFLGLIIEKVTGQTYEEYLQEAFFGPLGMEDTYYCSSSEVVRKKAYGYNFSPEGLRQKTYLDHTWPYAAGSLCSTTNDLLAWMQALHKGKVLSSDGYTSMITPETLKNGEPLRYAKGLTHYEHHGQELISHGGGIHGFLSETRYFPEEDLYIICLVNTAGPKGGSHFAEQLSWQLLEKKRAKAHKMDIDPATLEGTYTGPARGQTINVEVKALEDALIVGLVDREDRDTFDIYLGDKTWQKDNDIIKFRDGLCHIDQVSGYYILAPKAKN